MIRAVERHPRFFFGLVAGTENGSDRILFQVLYACGCLLDCRVSSASKGFYDKQRTIIVEKLAFRKVRYAFPDIVDHFLCRQIDARQNAFRKSGNIS